jgi:hypothetical protein
LVVDVLILLNFLEHQGHNFSGSISRNVCYVVQSVSHRLTYEPFSTLRKSFLGVIYHLDHHRLRLGKSRNIVDVIQAEESH